MKRFFVTPSLVILIFTFIGGCASHYSSVRPEREKETAQIIVAPPHKIMSVLLDIVEENFPGAVIKKASVESGKILFEYRGFWHGDVAVSITVKYVTGINQNGNEVRGYSIDIDSRGIPPKSSFLPGYAITRINKAFTRVMEEHGLPFITVKDAKVIRLKTEIPEGTEGKKRVAHGTGFTLGKLPIVTTNYHVVGEAKDVDIVFQSGQIVKGKVINRDEKNDLALISFEEFRKDPVGFQIFPSYKVKPGQEVYVIGYPMETMLGGDPGITNGLVSSTLGLNGDRRHFRITAQINPGNSGGPLLDGQGRVIGIISYTLNKLNIAMATGQIPEGTNFAIKSDVILNLFPDFKDLINEEETLLLSAENIFSIYSKAVVIVRSVQK